MRGSIAIVGAGIGGLTAALMLRQKGFTVSVYEAAPEIKPVGAGIVMANNAMQVFKKLGIQDRIEYAGNKVSVMEITDEQLRPLSMMRPEKFGQQYGVCNIAIHRADLQKILAETFGNENIHLSKRLSSIGQGNRLKLHFEDNTSATAGVLIGADGIRSVVRQHILDGTVIRGSGQVCWRGICKTGVPEKYRHTAVEAWGRGKRFGFVQLDGEKVYWYAVINKGLLKEQKDIPALFTGFHPDLLDMAEKTGMEDIHFSEIADLKPLSRWSAGNICLLGDAAHATTPNLGQGACQAVEDAYALGVLLSPGNNIENAFRSYEKMRVKKAHAVVSRSRILGQIAHIENGAGRWLRNALMKLTPSSAADRQLQWLFDIGYIKE